MTDVKLIDVTRSAVGAIDLFATDRIAALEIGGKPDDLDIAVLRILGVRQVVQAAVQGFNGFRRLGVAVDTLHALSMIALAVLGPKRTRRAALIQTAVATSFAAVGYLGYRRSMK